MATDRQMERVTVTLTREQVSALWGLVAKNKVAIAWLVHHAIKKFLENGQAIQLPLDLRQAS